MISAGKKLLHPISWVAQGVTSNVPILYFHFLLNPLQNEILGINSFTNEIHFQNKVIPKFHPRQLLYIGERKEFQQLQHRVTSYPWLYLYINSITYTHIFILPVNHFKYDEPDKSNRLSQGNRMPRKTLEALIYYDLTKKHENNKRILRRNRGMQFIKKTIYSGEVKTARHNVHSDLRAIILH